MFMPAAGAATAARACTRPCGPAETRRVCRWGKRVGRNRVARLMHEHGIQAHRRRPLRKTTDSNHAFPPALNLLDRQFASAVALNQVWLADMTYIAPGEGGCILPRSWTCSRASQTRSVSLRLSAGP